MDRLATLRKIISDHHQLWAVLYPESDKPKLHHLLHVPDGIAYLGKVIACFTCERKHRELKRSAINVYRHFEHTTLIDMLNSMTAELEGHDIFAEQALVRCSRKTVIGDVELHMSKSALCYCGEVHEDDVCVFMDGSVGKAIAFWQRADDSPIAIQCVLFDRVVPNVDVFSESTMTFAPLSDVMDTLIWHRICDDRIRVAMPPASVFP